MQQSPKASRACWKNKLSSKAKLVAAHTPLHHRQETRRLAQEGHQGGGPRQQLKSIIIPSYLLESFNLLEIFLDSQVCLFPTVCQFGLAHITKILQQYLCCTSSIK